MNNTFENGLCIIIPAQYKASEYRMAMKLSDFVKRAYAERQNEYIRKITKKARRVSATEKGKIPETFARIILKKLPTLLQYISAKFELMREIVVITSEKAVIIRGTRTIFERISSRRYRENESFSSVSSIISFSPF
jgi:hypothetical protein